MAGFPAYRSWLVVEIAGSWGPASLAGKFLADNGCTVVRIEDDDAMTGRAGLDELDAELSGLVSGGKQSARMDWSKPQAAEVMKTLLEKAEILLVDGPGLEAVRRALGGADPSDSYPGLTVCACTPFGLSGPMAGWSGGEEIVQAASGIMSVTGHIGSGPTRIAGAPLTLATAMYAVTSALGDVMRKRADGEGRGARLDVAIYDTAIAFEVTSLPALFLSGEPPRGIGNRHSMSIPWNTYPCSDGWVVICCGNHATWARLCEAMGRPDMPADPRYMTQDDRVRRVDEVDGIVAGWTGKRTVAEVVDILNAAGVAVGPILPLTEVLDLPQLSARSLPASGGTCSAAGGAFHLNNEALGAAARPDATIAGFLLDRAGASPAQVARWRDAGVIGDIEVADAKSS